MASSSCAAWFSIATCSSQSWRRMVTISAILAAAGSWRTTWVGMVATYSAISRASIRSFLARAPRARANCRSLLGLMRRTDRPAASKARRNAALVAAARLEPDRRDGHVPQPGDERVPACLVVGDRETCGLRQQQHVANEALLYHPRVPCLLVGLGPGQAFLPFPNSFQNASRIR